MYHTHQTNRIRKSPNILEYTSCCICGSTNCSQSIDHNRVTLAQFKARIKKVKNSNTNLQPLKKKIDRIYTSLRSNIDSVLKREHKKAIEWFNKFYFQGVDGNKVDITFLAQIQNGNYDCLPHRNIKNWIRYFDEWPTCPQQKKAQQIKKDFQFEKQVNEFILNFNPQKIIHELKESLFVESIKKDDIATPKLKAIQTVVQKTPQKTQAITQYNWKNVRLTQTSRNANFSNKDLKDQDMIQQLPMISGFKNLKQLELRYNPITYLTCRCISENLSFISSLDIRGCKIGDKGAIILVKGMTGLKILMLSQTNITDATAQQIAKGVNDLQTLWCEKNEITGKYLTEIANKKRLRVLSLKGNPISLQDTQNLKKHFGAKGYISL